MRWFADIFVLIGDVRRELPRAIDVWGFLLNVPQILGGAAFVVFPEGAGVLAAWFAAMLVGGRIHRLMRFSRLIGVCHAVWLPLVPFLVIRAASGPLEGQGIYGIVFVCWLWYVAVTMSVSIVFDAYDFWRYVTSDDRTMKLRG